MRLALCFLLSALLCGSAFAQVEGEAPAEEGEEPSIITVTGQRLDTYDFLQELTRGDRCPRNEVGPYGTACVNLSYCARADDAPKESGECTISEIQVQPVFRVKYGGDTAADVLVFTVDSNKSVTETALDKVMNRKPSLGKTYVLRDVIGRTEFKERYAEEVDSCDKKGVTPVSKDICTAWSRFDYFGSDAHEKNFQLGLEARNQLWGVEDSPGLAARKSEFGLRGPTDPVPLPGSGRQ